MLLSENSQLDTGEPMPREDRRIMFDYTEVYKAIFTLCTQKEMRRPLPGEIKGIIEKAEDDQIVIVKIANLHQETAAATEYSRDFLAAALMLYCRACHIPLPKKALKSVEINGDNVVLRISI